MSVNERSLIWRTAYEILFPVSHLLPPPFVGCWEKVNNGQVIRSAARRGTHCFVSIYLVTSVFALSCAGKLKYMRQWPPLSSGVNSSFRCTLHPQQPYLRQQGSINTLLDLDLIIAFRRCFRAFLLFSL